MASLEKPRDSMPSENLVYSFSRASFFFFPIARRNKSAPPSVYPASCWAIAITCSW